jgi:hypothetical protein
LPDAFVWKKTAYQSIQRQHERVEEIMNQKITKKLLISLAKKCCAKKDLNKLTDADKHAIAVELYKLGYIHSSSSYEDIPSYEPISTAGYGKLDDFGFFEYPLYEKDIKPGLNKHRIQQKEAGYVG